MKVTIRQWKVVVSARNFPLNKLQRIIIKLFRISPIEAYRVRASFECDIVIPVDSILTTEHNYYRVLSAVDGKYKCEVTKYTNYIETCVRKANVSTNKFIL